MERERLMGALVLQRLKESTELVGLRSCNGVSQWPPGDSISLAYEMMMKAQGGGVLVDNHGWAETEQAERAQVRGSAPSEAIGNCSSNGRRKDRMHFSSHTAQKPAGRGSACGAGKRG